MSTDTPWAGPDKSIRKAFRSAKSYDIIDAHSLGDTWSSGGCWVAAEAIKRRFGGDLRAIWDGRAGLTHVVVEKRGVMIDAEGKPLARAAFLKRYAKQEHLTPPVYVEAFREADAERNGIVFSPDAVDEAMALLGGARSNPGKRLTFVNPADIITAEDGYFVKKAALRKLQKAIYDNTGEWCELSEVEYIVNKMLAKAAHDKFTIVHGKHFKQANPRRKRG